MIKEIQEIIIKSVYLTTSQGGSVTALNSVAIYSEEH